MDQTQQQPTGQQQYMQQPPFVISTKDLLYLEDMMSWNLNAVKKVHFFAEHVQDPEIKNTMHEMCKMHEHHYQMLLNHMHQHIQSSTNTPSGGMQS